jgi:hypothetical protein
MRNAARLAAVAALLAAVLGACGSSPEPPASGPSTPAASAPADAQGRASFEAFVAAVNAGDEPTTRDLFAPEARFDSVGRIYPDREAIFGRFLGPEVIRAGGQYALLDVRAGADGRTVAEFDFTTRSGAQEHFTYDCAIADGRFTDCVGRYV